MPLPTRRKRRHSPDVGGSTTSQNDAESSNVKVVVRVRPENGREKGSRVVTQVMNENVLVFDPKENTESGYNGGRKKPRDLRKRQNRDLKFAFDQVFGPEVPTSDVYEQTTKSILTGLLNGYNCSVFAYGATGAGKTHTMLGSKQEPGVMYLTMNDLYKRIDAMKETKTCDVAVSYLEVYNETIRDLMMPSGCLPIREDPNNGVVVHGLSLHKPKTAEELLYMLQVGNQHRTQHPTDANAESSRSHAVFQVFIRQKDRTANLSAEVKIAKLCLIDLAGSERATVTKNRGSRFREGANINRSLLALGNVINALAENKNKGFIPYRDSKLTRLLKDSLGGNCQTVMIAAVSPSTCSFEDTYNTLRYADRAKNIKSTLKKNVLNVDFHIARYGQIVEELRREILELKEKVKEYEEKPPPTDTPVLQQSVTQDHIRLYEEINSVYRPVLTSRGEQLDSEANLLDLQWKIYRRERSLSRLAVIDESNNKESVDKLRGMIASMRQKSAFLSTKVEVGQDKMTEGINNITCLKQRLTSSCGDNGRIPEPISLCFQVNTLKSDLQDSHKHISYLKRSMRCQERELQHNERLVHRLLKIIRRQHYIIKGHNMMTSDLVNEYKAIQQIAAGQELQWEDETENSSFRPGYRFTDMLDLPSLLKKRLPTGNCPASTASLADVGPSIPDKIEQDGSGQLVCKQPTKNVMVKQLSNTSLPQMETDSMMDLSKITVDEIDEKSPEEDYVPKQKFLKLNDTITKCKKYVRLHTVETETHNSGANSSKAGLNETFNLDGTFTMDPSNSSVPLSVMPCVDGIQPAVSCAECQGRNSEFVSETGSRDSLCPNQFEINRKTSCDKCKCAIEPRSETEPGSLSLCCDPNDDSGASTLVNSQATVSTLNDSQNLSSVSEFSDIGITKCTNIILGRLNNTDKYGSQSSNLSDTFTKFDSSSVSTHRGVESIPAGATGVKAHVARSIKFEEGDNSKDTIGSGFVTKEAGRQPLQQVGSNNMTSSSSFEPFVFKGGSQENLSQSQPLRVPNLSRSNSTVSINKSNQSLKGNQSFTPSYMKTTKAVARRCEVKLHAIDDPSPPETKNSMSQLKRFKSTFFSRKARPLTSSMRSKSTSNLSSRAAWQL